MTVRLLSAKVAALLLCVGAMLAPMLFIGQGEADATGACPRWTVADVLADPNGDWDGDRVTNVDEVYIATLNPCVADSAKFCSTNAVHCKKISPCSGYYGYYGHGYWYNDVDSDNDGVSDYYEVINGANPCDHPCPYPSSTDVALNRYGDWDADGINNRTEVLHGTNPCSSGSFLPCPYWSQRQVNLAPYSDWDGDGVTNADEVRHGTNPCHRGVYYHQPRVTTYQAPQRLPHVTTYTPTYTPPPQPTVTVQPTCPAGYPYYHPGNGKCYANPVRPWG